MYGDHWDLELLEVMIAEHFRGIMGLPQGTQLWQLADRYNNGLWQINIPLAKRTLLGLKREDLMKPKAEQRYPVGEHDRLVPTDQVIIFRMAYEKCNMDISANKKAIAETGIKPFTKVRAVPTKPKCKLNATHFAAVPAGRP